MREHPKSELPEADESSAARGAGADRLVRIGAVVFGVGLLAVAAAIIPLFFGVHDLPTALNVAAGVLPPLGFVLALWGLVRAARAQRWRTERYQAER